MENLLTSPIRSLGPSLKTLCAGPWLAPYTPSRLPALREPDWWGEEQEPWKGAAGETGIRGAGATALKQRPRVEHRAPPHLPRPGPPALTLGFIATRLRPLSTAKSCSQRSHRGPSVLDPCPNRSVYKPRPLRASPVVGLSPSKDPCSATPDPSSEKLSGRKVHSLSGSETLVCPHSARHRAYRLSSPGLLPPQTWDDDTLRFLGVRVITGDPGQLWTSPWSRQLSRVGFPSSPGLRAAQQQ